MKVVLLVAAVVSRFGDRQGVARPLVSVEVFTIRDSMRLSDYVHPYTVVDFVDPRALVQTPGEMRQSMYVNARRVRASPCHQYSHACYKRKMLLSFRTMLHTFASATHFFYYEADNTLCTTLLDLHRIAAKYQRPIILTGIGASGWLMQRAWMERFIDKYARVSGVCPDCVAATMPHWTTYYKYLVSHQHRSAEAGLTVKPGHAAKHLPRCHEPHRSRFDRGDSWDYFEADGCDVYPCNKPHA